MAWRIVVLAAMSGAWACALVSGCGGGSNAAGAALGDGAPPEAGTGDALVADVLAGDAGDDAPPWPEGAVPPHGKQLVQSATAVLEALTTDGYAIYTDLGAADPTLVAVPLDGGKPVTIGAFDFSGAGASGPVVVYFDGIVQTTNAGTLGVWTSAHGQQTLSTEALLGAPGGGLLDVSDDGRHVLFFDHASAAIGDVTVVDVDGSNRAVLVPGVRLDDPSCTPTLGFAGALAVVAYCPPPGDAGAGDGSASDGGAAPPATIATFTGAGWATVATIARAALPGFAHDAAGARLQYVTSAGLLVAQLGSGLSTAIDPAGTMGLFTSDGAHVAYVTSAGAVMLAPSDGATPPVTLQGSGFATLYAISPDDRWLVGAKQEVTDPNTGVTTSDLYLVPATAGVTSALEAKAIGGLAGDPFTADSSHALFETNIAPSAELPVGDLFASPTSGGAPVALGAAVWSDTALRGSAVLFSGNFALGVGAAIAGTDLEWVDTASSSPPTVLVSFADPTYFTTRALDQVVYSWSYAQDGRAGIWVLPLP